MILSRGIPPKYLEWPVPGNLGRWPNCVLHMFNFFQAFWIYYKNQSVWQLLHGVTLTMHILSIVFQHYICCSQSFICTGLQWASWKQSLRKKKIKRKTKEGFNKSLYWDFTFLKDFSSGIQNWKTQNNFLFSKKKNTRKKRERKSFFFLPL